MKRKVLNYPLELINYNTAYYSERIINMDRNRFYSKELLITRKCEKLFFNVFKK